MTTRTDVAALYVATFDRSPDAPGLDYWAAQMDDHGWTIEMVAQSFFDQPETERKYPDTMPNGDFINEVYNNVLDRDPDQAGFDYWLEQLDSGAVARNDFIVAIVNAVLDPAGNVDDFHLLNNKMIVGVFFADCGYDEPGHAATSLVGVTGDYATVETAKALIAQMPYDDPDTRSEVTALYIATFDRSPDSAGLDYWTAKIEAEGWTIEMVSQSFFDQPETKEKYPDALSNEDLVNEVYNNVLGRDPDQAGFEYWVEQLDSGAVARYDFIIAIVNAVLQPGGNQDDLAYLSNKMEVGEFFADSGREDADDAALSLIGVGGHYSTVISAKDSVLGMSGGEPTLDAMLTTGVDNFTGVFGNDIVTGVVDDVLDDTLTDGDTFDGARGTDTLKILSNTADLTLEKIEVTDVEKLEVINTSAGWESVDIANRSFKEISLDGGGKSSSGLDVNHVNAMTAVTLTNLRANNQANVITFDTDNVSTAGKTMVEISDVNLAGGNENFESHATFSAAKTVYTTVSLMDIRGNGNDSNYAHYLDTGTMKNVAVNTTVNIENVKVGDKSRAFLYTQQAGGSVNNVVVNLTNTDNVATGLFLDFGNNGTSAEDVLTLNLNGVKNSAGNSIFATTDIEKFSVNVLANSEIDVISNNINWDGSDMGDVVVNLNAKANLSVGFWDFSDTLGDNTTFNITGSGNITINQFDNNNGGNVVVAASAATGDISLGRITMSNKIVSITTGSGNDSIKAGLGEILIQTNGGADNIDIAKGDATVRYVSATDSQLKLTSNQMSGFDVIGGFFSGSDIVQLSSSLGLANSSLLDKGVIPGTTPADMQTFIGDGIGFFGGSSTAFADDGTDGYLYIDANNDGDFTEGLSETGDMMIQLTGVTNLETTDIQFGE